MDNLMDINNEKEEEDYISGADLDEVNSEIDEETDIEELIRHIHFLKPYIPTIVNEKLIVKTIEYYFTVAKCNFALKPLRI